MNEILRRAILSAGLDEVDVAARLEVDPKTVRRWLEGRIPYARHRWALADLLKLDQVTLWPELRVNRSRPDDLLGVYPHRYSIPREIWRHFFTAAKREISILECASLPLSEHAEIVRIFTEKAQEGVCVRIVLGDPSNPYFVSPEEREEINGAASARIQRTLSLLGPLHGISNIDIRLQRVMPYGSIYRADSDLLCSQYTYGLPAEAEPVLHLRHQENSDMTNLYINAFNDIWMTAVAFS